jgi:hypothetical protein
MEETFVKNHFIVDLLEVKEIEDLLKLRELFEDYEKVSKAFLKNRKMEFRT